MEPTAVEQAISGHSAPGSPPFQKPFRYCGGFNGRRGFQISHRSLGSIEASFKTSPNFAKSEEGCASEPTRIQRNNG